MARKEESVENGHHAGVEVEGEVLEVAGGEGGGGDGSDDGGRYEGGGGGGAEGGDGADGSRSGDGKDAVLTAVLPKPVAEKAGVVGKVVKSGVGLVSSSVGHAVNTVLNRVPAAVLVAILSIASTLGGSKIKASRDLRVAQINADKAEQLRKMEDETRLRKWYAELSNPLLMAASKVADNLFDIVDDTWVNCASSSPDFGTEKSATYAAYLVGRLFATLEIFKDQSVVGDHGFPAADHVLANIIGRIRGALAADDVTFAALQRSERYFKPEKGKDPLPAGPIRINLRTQGAAGELLLRRRWSKNGIQINSDSSSHAPLRGSDAVLTFVEFTKLLEEDKHMANWYNPIIKDFVKLEKISANSKLSRDERRKRIGARSYVVQCALIDLVEFLDPNPRSRFVPQFRRNRLRLGALHSDEEQRKPASLRRLYNELANVRDRRVKFTELSNRLRKDALEVYVTNSMAEDDTAIEPSVQGDCPFSQRVLICLEEMGIPYKAVAMPGTAKPSWFHLLHAQNVTPVVYHNGVLIEDSKQIVAYLLAGFPKHKPLATTAHLKLAVGTSAFTRFHPRFKAWLSGNKDALKDVEGELRKLNKTLADIQKLNNGLPFVGGAALSREDTAIAPMLHHVSVAGPALMKWNIPADCTALRAYLDAMKKIPSFAKTAAPDDVIIKGYGHLKEGLKPRIKWAALRE